MWLDFPDHWRREKPLRLSPAWKPLGASAPKGLCVFKNTTTREVEAFELDCAFLLVVVCSETQRGMKDMLPTLCPPSLHHKDMETQAEVGAGCWSCLCG